LKLSHHPQATKFTALTASAKSRWSDWLSLQAVHAVNASDDPEEQGNPLPSRAFVTLTEALTWILDRHCRTDEQLRQEARASFKINQEEWITADGPRALIPHLQLLADGKTWQFDENSDLTEWDKANALRGIERTQEWLISRRLTPEQGLELAKSSVAEENEQDRRESELLETLRDQCAAGNIALYGIELDANRQHPTGQHELIPTE
jgi:hypothetical protein